jgi:hypothetical protein
MKLRENFKKAPSPLERAGGEVLLKHLIWIH